MEWVTATELNCFRVFGVVLVKKHATRLVIKTVVADSAGLLVNQLIQLQGNQILSSVSMTLAKSMLTFSLWDTVAEGSTSDLLRLRIGL